MLHNKAGRFLGETPRTGSGLMSGLMPPNQTPVIGRMQEDPYRSGPLTSLQGQAGNQGLHFPEFSSPPRTASASAAPAEPWSAIPRTRRDALGGPDSRVQAMPSRGDAFGGVAALPDHDTNRGGWGTRGAVFGGKYEHISTASGAFDRTSQQMQQRPSSGGAALFRPQARAAGPRSPSLDDPSDTDIFSAKLKVKRRTLGAGGEYVSGVSRVVARGSGAADPLNPLAVPGAEPAWSKHLDHPEALDPDERESMGLKAAPESRWLLNPRSAKMMYWDALVGLCLLFTATFTPYEVAFIEKDALNIEMDARFVLNRVVDLVFLTDICFNFFLPYAAADNSKFITDHWQIVRHYLYGWFFVDVASVIPYDIIAFLVQEDSYANLKVLRAIRLLRLAKLLRVVRVGRIFRRFEATHEVNYAALALWKFSLGIFFLAHWMACLFYLIAAAEDRATNWVTSYFEYYDRNARPDGTYEPIDSGTMYIASVYWAVATLSTLGYGDVIPETNAERLYAVACTFAGGAVYAYLLGSVCSIITNLDEGSNTFFRQMDELNRFMMEKGISTDLRVKLRDFFRFRRKSRAMVEWSGVMHLMSDSLRLDVAEEVFGGWVRAMPILKDCPRRLPAMLSAHLSSLVLSPHEDLMANPLKRDCLFIIEKGLIAHRGCIQEVGTLLGVERIYRYGPGVKEPCGPAITLCHCVVLCLERDALLQVVSEFPKTERTMRRAVARIKLRDAAVRYARAIIASVRGKGDGMVILHKMLGGDVCTTLTALARHHRLAFLRRDAPDLFAAMVSAVIRIQRHYRGHRARVHARDLREFARHATPGARALQTLLVRVGMEKHAGAMRALNLEAKHLEIISATELCQVTAMRFSEAADLLFAARRGGDARGGSGDDASNDASNDNASNGTTRRAEEHLARDVTASPAPSDADAGVKFVAWASRLPPGSPAPRRPWNDAERIGDGRGAVVDHDAERVGDGRGAVVDHESVVLTTSASARKRRPTSTSVYAARAFGTGKPDVGMTVLLAASKFREGGERYRARKQAEEEEEEVRR